MWIKVKWRVLRSWREVSRVRRFWEFNKDKVWEVYVGFSDKVSGFFGVVGNK